MNGDPVLNDSHLDFLVELMTMGAGKSSEILSEILDTHIRLSIPAIRQMRTRDLASYIPRFLDRKLSVVDLQFHGELSGESKLIFPIKSARALGDLLLEEEIGEDLDSARIGVITELGNIVLNSIMGTISNYLNLRFDFTIPVYENQFRNNIPPDHNDDTDMILLANTRFSAESLKIEGDIALLFSIESLGRLVKIIDKYLEDL